MKKLRPKTNNLRIIYHSIGIFGICIILSWLFSREVNGQNFSLGFPFAFYEQFKLRGNDYVNFGWDINNFFFDIFITLFFTISILINCVKKRNL